MGMWDYISSAADSVRQRSSDLTSVKGFARSSYDCSWYAVTRVNKAVRVDAVGMVNRQLSDPEARSHLLNFSSSLVKNAAVEGAKTLPGVWPVVKVILKSAKDSNNSNKCVDLSENKINEREELEVVKASLSRMGKELHDLEHKLVLQRMEMEMPKRLLEKGMLKDVVGAFLDPKNSSFQMSYRGYKFFTEGNKGEKKEEKVGQGSH